MSNTVTFNEQPTDFSAWMNDADMQDMHVNNVDETGRSLSELSIDELFITFRVYDEKRAQNNV